LIERHGAAHAESARRGVRQVAERWWPEDGDRDAFASFCEEAYLPDEDDRAFTFSRLEERLEQIAGRLHEIRRETREPVDLDSGPIRRVDALLAAFDLSAHVVEDLFRSRVAFLALLNFPVHTLAERLRDGARYSREEWARSRLVERFAHRVPPAVLQAVTRAEMRSEVYIGGYFIRMDRVETDSGERLFEEGLRLISHWGLRDELRARYVEGDAGLPRQRLIQCVMERIIRQEIPEAVRDNPDLLWRPGRNEVRRKTGGAPDASLAAREPDTRYERMLEMFHAVRAVDPYTPSTPTYIRRKFELDRQVPEDEVERLAVAVLAAPQVSELAAVIRRRLGRPLEPFDIWYSGFKPRAGRPEEELDAEVRRRYPSRDAFQADLPNLLGRLGFTPERARWLSDRILVDASRGAGHAMPALRRSDRVHLRTRIPEGGMKYQGYNVALHELGHNVEQVFSLHGVDHWSLAGVPNTGCTEAFAFAFQGRDLEVLGHPDSSDAAWQSQALDALWSAAEIAGVSLVDMWTWRWMYAHPEASAAELHEAVRSAAREVWNRWFAPLIQVENSDLLAIYSHMVAEALYLPDYLIGRLIAVDVARHLRTADFAAEVERIARQGCLTPEAWMRGAVGRPLSADGLLEEAERALRALGTA
jgi:hypothetical protein